MNWVNNNSENCGSLSAVWNAKNIDIPDLISDIRSNVNMSDDEKIDVAAKRIMNRFKPAFEELAKW